MAKSSPSSLAYKPQGQVLKGRYVGPFRSGKGKIKGLKLAAPQGDYTIKLPKYLRPMLVRGLSLGEPLQVWAYQDDDQWRAINVLPLPPAEVAALTVEVPLAERSLQPQQDRATCVVEVCRKGKCYRQGSLAMVEALQRAANANPELRLDIRPTGCMKACKQGPNVRLGDRKKLMHRASAEQVLAALS